MTETVKIKAKDFAEMILEKVEKGIPPANKEEEAWILYYALLRAGYSSREAREKVFTITGKHLPSTGYIVIILQKHAVQNPIRRKIRKQISDDIREYLEKQLKKGISPLRFISEWYSISYPSVRHMLYDSLDENSRITYWQRYIDLWKDIKTGKLDRYIKLAGRKRTFSRNIVVDDIICLYLAGYSTNEILKKLKVSPTGLEYRLKPVRKQLYKLYREKILPALVERGIVDKEYMWSPPTRLSPTVWRHIREALDKDIVKLKDDEVGKILQKCKKALKQNTKAG